MSPKNPPSDRLAEADLGGHLARKGQCFGLVEYHLQKCLAGHG